MGFSAFEFRPIRSFRYMEGYLVWRVQETLREETFCFRPLGSRASKFGCAVKTYAISAIINNKTCYTGRLLSVRVVTGSAVGTPDSVL